MPPSMPFVKAMRHFGFKVAQKSAFKVKVGAESAKNQPSVFAIEELSAPTHWRNASVGEELKPLPAR